VAGQLFAEGEEAGVGGVVGVAGFDGADGGVADGPGGDEVGLADAEGDDVIHGGHDVEEATNAGGGEGLGALREAGVVGFGVGRHGARVRRLDGRFPPHDGG
jgi:hypothetical protein